VFPRGLTPATRAMAAMMRWFYSTPLYRLSLAGATPRRLVRLPPASSAGDPRRGEKILAGELVCAKQTFDALNPDWFSAAASLSALGELHSFGWLDDLAALATADAQSRARTLVARWLDVADSWHPIAWEPAILGLRLARILAQARFLSAGDNDPLSRPLLTALARQVRHLDRTATSAEAGVDALVAAKGLLFARLCGFGDRAGRRALGLLEREARRQILADGGHVSRSPAIHVSALAVLMDIHDMLEVASQPIPAWLPDGIGRMTAMLRFFQHGDGELAFFNGAHAESRTALRTVSRRAGRAEPSERHAVHSGFVRLSAEQTLVLVDVGAPPEAPHDRSAHAGTLSFELSCGTERLIVNCGARSDSSGPWRAAERSTAAHSTVAVGGLNSSEVLADDGLGRRPHAVSASLEGDDGNFWLTASHNGYEENLKVVVRRRLYLAAGGSDLRGEDTVIGAYQGDYAIRFHLHPDIRASLVQSSAAILLRTPTDVAWRMQVSQATLSIEESIYLDPQRGLRRAEQIVLNGRLSAPETVVKWALRRIN
jgi:uncharacterized heparinase superfamily protein